MNEDETPAYWSTYGADDLVVRVAALHAQRRELIERAGEAEVYGARKAVAETFLRGSGIEVGAGSRPFPLPKGANCYYGDIRDAAELAAYFKAGEIANDGRIDAQTMQGVPSASQDFVISAHVIEHLFDPIGAIRAAGTVLKAGGIFICVAPDMDKTFDRARTPTTLEHLQADSQDGGESTRLQAYVEHVKYVHPILTGEHYPADEIEPRARAIMAGGIDVHVHAWRATDFGELLSFIVSEGRFSLETLFSVQNENIAVLRRTQTQP
jgi:SAM-dependent methyltransferase